MEQVHRHWVVKEEEQQQQLQDAALEALQHRKDSIIATAVAPSFSSPPTNSGVCSASVEEQPLLQKEEQRHTHKEEQKVEETGNVVENDTHFNDDSEFVGNAINGEAIINVATSQNKNSVYFDKQQGNDVDGARSVLTKSLGEGEFDIRVENSGIQRNPCNEVNNQCMKTVVDKVPSGSELLPLHNLSEIQATSVENCGDESSAKAYPNLAEEIDQQLKELDVEAVLAKQETHDLFCPNCKSCITKRVILRKRKRNIPNLDTKAKRDKSDTEQVNSSLHEANQGGHATATSDVGRLEPPADNYEPEREPEVFRCLSCFSFFITMRNGIFTLFTSNKGRKASGQGDASIENSRTDPAEQHNVLTSPGIGNPESPLANAAISKNVKLTSDIKPGHGEVNSPIPRKVKSAKTESWIENGNKSSMASWNEPLVDPNDLSCTQSCTESSSDVMNGLQNVRRDFIDISTREKLLTENVRTDVREKKHDSVDMIKTDISKGESILLATVATTEIHFNAGKPAKDAILKSYEGSPIFEKSQKDVDKTPEIAQDSYSSLMEEAQSFGSAVVANDVASDKQRSGVNATIPSDHDFKKVQKDIEEEINPSVAKEKKEAFKSSTSQTAYNIPIEGAIVTETHTQIYIGEQPRAEIGEHQEWEILKSIVYGGLIESITSLGIVSSAAASGASPLNIIALGLANLIGGLFVIGHNLIELKNDHSGGEPQQMNMQEDRYQEQLGRRADFLLHAVVAVLSFLIFGSVPLVVYGVLIGKHYHAEVKLAAVAATSVGCIILLAIGKVYATRPPKSYVKTVLHYVTLALATSGISYIAGDLVKDLLDKFSGSESGYVLTMPFSGTRRMKPEWMSY